MKIVLANKITIHNPSNKIKTDLINQLTMINPAFIEAERRGYSTYKIPKVLTNFDILPDGSLRIPRGMKERLIAQLQDVGESYTVENKLTYNTDNNKIIGITAEHLNLRSYQRKYLYQLLSSGKTEGIIVAPPGSGKTVFATALISALGQNTLWLTHRKLLLKQSKERFLSNIEFLRNEDVGIIQKGKWNVSPIITIASLDTMRGNVSKIRKISKQFGLVILDETHHVPAQTFNKTVAELSPYYLFGLTATPYRSDGLDPLMFQAIGDPIITIPAEEVAMEGGIIMPTIYYKPMETKTIDGNNIHQILKYLMNNEKRNYAIVSDVLSGANSGRVGIVISNRKDHCEILYKLIKIAWDGVGIVTGDYSDKHCDEQIRKLERGEINTIVATGEKFGEGVDINIIEDVYIALPFRSEQDVEQIIGRAQRTAPGKHEARVFEYIDHNIGVVRDQFSTPTKNKECRLNAYKRLGLTIKPVE